MISGQPGIFAIGDAAHGFFEFLLRPRAENPTLCDAREVSVLLFQRRRHDSPRWTALTQAAQGKVIGRMFGTSEDD